MFHPLVSRQAIKALRKIIEASPNGFDGLKAVATPQQQERIARSEVLQVAYGDLVAFA
jgi:hypothetical protein